MKSRWLLAIFLLGGYLNAGLAETHRTVDGRFNTECIPPPGEREGLCLVSFYRLIANPESYDGKKVQLTGFLVYTFGNYVIFPSRDSYKANIPSEGIEFQGKIKFDRGFSKNVKSGYFPIRVSGVFDAHYQGPGLVRLGALREVRVYDYKFITD